MRIARDGTWFYHATPIGRKELVRLFSTVLTRRDDGSFWLVTPAEEGIIDVEDAPFIAIELNCDGAGHDARLSFRTNVDDEVTLDDAHGLRIASGEHGPLPYIHVRNGLEARLARPVYYQLVEFGQEDEIEGRRRFGVWSSGKFFSLEEAS